MDTLKYQASTLNKAIIAILYLKADTAAIPITSPKLRTTARPVIVGTKVKRGATTDPALVDQGRHVDSIIENKVLHTLVLDRLILEKNGEENITNRYVVASKAYKQKTRSHH